MLLNKKQAIKGLKSEFTESSDSLEKLWPTGKIEQGERRTKILQ